MDLLALELTARRARFAALRASVRAVEIIFQELRRVQGILRLAKRHPITVEALDHACQRTLGFNKTRLAYIKDCALYFVTHGQRPTLLAPSRQADTVHLHQLLIHSEMEEEIL